MCTIGHETVFSLSPWSGRIHAGFRVSSTTWDTARVFWNVAYRALTFFGGIFQFLLLSLDNPFVAVPRPLDSKLSRFRLFPVRSPLLGKSMSFSIPRVTEMFHFSRYRLLHLWIQWRILQYNPQRVSPFGSPRIKVCLRLPGAYRRLPRPSSPPRAKSSIISS